MKRWPRNCLLVLLITSIGLFLIWTDHEGHLEAAQSDDASDDAHADTYLPLVWNSVPRGDLAPPVTVPPPSATIIATTTQIPTSTETVTVPSATATPSATNTATPISAPTFDLPPPPPTPPLAMLTVNDERQESGVATFCWRGPGGGLGCMDYKYVATPYIEMTVPAQFEAKFELVPEPVPTWIYLMVMKVTPSDEVFITNKSFRWWGGGTPLVRRELDLSRQPTTDLNLDAGLYVFNLYVFWDRPGESLGDAHYGFLVEVEPEAD